MDRAGASSLPSMADPSSSDNAAAPAWMGSGRGRSRGAVSPAGSSAKEVVLMSADACHFPSPAKSQLSE